MDISFKNGLVELYCYDKKIGSFERPYFMSGDTLDEFMSDIDSKDFEWYFHCEEQNIVLLKTGSNEYCFKNFGSSFYFDKKVALKLGGIIGTL